MFAAKERLTIAQEGRMKPDPEPVPQSSLSQTLDESGAAKRYNILTRHRLQPANLFHCVSVYKLGVAILSPGNFLQSARSNNLRGLVHRVSPGTRLLGLTRPSTRHNLVCLTSQQERARGLLQPSHVGTHLCSIEIVHDPVHLFTRPSSESVKADKHRHNQFA